MMFDLEPCDTPRDADPSWFAFENDVPFGGETWHVAAETAGNTFAPRILMQRAAGPPLVPLKSPASHLPFDCDELSLHAMNAGALLHAVNSCLRYRSWGRALFLNERFELRRAGELARYEVFVTSGDLHGGMGWWRTLTHGRPPVEQAAFRLPKLHPNELAQIPAAALLAWVWNLNEDESDFAFARRFLELSAQERTRFLWTCERGDLAELKRVLRMAFLALAPAELREDERVLVGNVELERVGMPNRCPIVIRSVRTEPVPALEAAFWRIIAWSGFQLHPEHQRHPCVGAFSMLHAGDLRFYFRVFNPKLAAHEIGFEPETTARDLAEAAHAWQVWRDAAENT